MASRYIAHKDAARLENMAAQGVLADLSKCAPHQVGDVIRWVEANRRKRIGGDSWHPVYEKLPDKECKAVVTRVYPSVSSLHNSAISVSYRYDFSPIKKDGGIANITVYPRGEYEWTGERIDIA